MWGANRVEILTVHHKRRRFVAATSEQLMSSQDFVLLIKLFIGTNRIAKSMKRIFPIISDADQHFTVQDPMALWFKGGVGHN